MKLRNKKTGEIIDDGYVRETHDFQFDGQKHVLAVFRGNGHRPPERVSGAYKSLAELNEEWEDVPEEPKEWYWFIEDNGIIQRSCHYKDLHPTLDKARKEIGNYFNTREEAEKAVEKLKAFKRLKDKGFRFEGWDNTDRSTIHNFSLFVAIEDLEGITEDLDLLFSWEVKNE